MWLVVDYSALRIGRKKPELPPPTLSLSFSLCVCLVAW